MIDIWFLRDCQRLTVEREAIRELEEKSDWLKGTNWRLDNSGLCLEAIIHVNGHDYAVKMVYPGLFPVVPPTVFPQDANERWSLHQYLNGALCLEWRPDTWHPNLTGAQVLESTYRLLEIEKPYEAGNIIAPVDHHFSIGQLLNRSYGRFYVNKELSLYVKNEVLSLAKGLVEFSVHFHSSSFVALIQNLQINQKQIWQDNSVPKGLRKSDNKHNAYSGLFLKTEIAAETLGNFNNIEDVETHLGNSGLNLNRLLEETGINNQQSFLGFLLTDETGSLYFYLRISPDSQYLWNLRKVESDGASNNPRLSTDLSILSTKSVAIIGLGSIGSKIGCSLARTGVGKFYFIDEDIFLPDNVCRNDLDWKSVGEHKVNAVKERISFISSAEVETSTVNVTGQEPNAVLDWILRKLQEYDVLIDATAHPKVFNLLASVAGTYKKPIVWGEIYAGGIGGMVARSCPDKDISPLHMRSAYDEYLSSHNAPFLNSPTHHQYGIENSDGETVTASDAEVDIIAGHLTRFVIDILLKREPSAFPYSLYLIGLQESWIFKAPFHTIPIDTTHLIEQEANLQSFPKPSEDSISENIDFLKNLFDTSNNNAHSPSQDDC